MSIERLQDELNKRRQSHQSPTMMQISQWITDHLVEIAWKTVDEVAREAAVSPASVIRCCRALNFSGYSHLQRTVRDTLPNSLRLVEKLRDFQDPAAGAPATRGVIDREKAILDLFGPPLFDQVEVLARHLLTSSRTGVIAGLTSASLGQYFASHLNVLLSNVTFCEAESSDSWLFLRDIPLSGLAIALTFPRYSRATLAMAQRFVKKGVPTVLITDRLGVGLISGTLSIGVPISEDLFSAGPPVTVLVQMLAHALKRGDPGRILQQLKDTDGILEQAGVFFKDRGYRAR